MNKYFRQLTLILIILFAIFIRCYQLGTVPAGLINDEADIGYDAYSILHTGRDQWNTFLPLTSFKGFGDNRPVLYAYFVIPSIAIFGATPLGIRFPSAVFGILSVIAIYFLVKKLFNERIGLVVSLLLAISPWAIGLSRVGIESNVALFFLLLGIYILTNIKKSVYYLFIAIFCFVLTLYTYTAYTLFIPLFLFTLTIYYRNYLLKNKKILFISILIFFILLIPFLNVKNTGFFSRASSEGFLVNTTSLGNILDINEKRGSCLTVFSQLICKLIANKPLEFSSIFVKNYLSHFSLDNLYLNATPVARVILPERGLEYMLEIILLLAGLIILLTKHSKFGVLLISLFLLSVVPDSLTGTGNFSRSSILIPFLLTIEAVGLVTIVQFLTEKYYVKKNIIYGSLAVIFIIVVGLFSLNYFTFFKIKYSTKYSYKELSENINLEKNNYNKIYVSNYFNDSEMHIFYLFYTLYNPLLYQKKTTVSYTIKSNNWVSIDKVDNIYFTDKLPVLQKEKNLYIAYPKAFPENVPVKKKIKNLRGDVIFLEVDSQELMRFETQLCNTDTTCILKSGWFK